LVAIGIAGVALLATLRGAAAYTYDPNGGISVTATANGITMSANSPGPTVSICAGGTVNFSASASDSDHRCDCEPVADGISYYYWQFGDGATSWSQSPSHAYPSSGGPWQVILTVDDSAIYADDSPAYRYCKIVVPTVTLKEISFTGDHAMYQNGDHGGWGVGAAIQDPVWKSESNPDAPVCYSKGSHVAMTAKLSVSPVPSPPLQVIIKADGPGNLDGEAAVSLGAAEVTANITTTGALESKVYKLTPLSFNWSMRCCQGCSAASIGSSSHRIYVTYGTPSPAGDLTETRIDKCVSDAMDATTPIGIADAIHPLSADFDGHPKCPAWNFGVNPAVEVPTNWYMYSPDESQWDVKGSCASYATLNKMMLDLLGVPGGSVVYIYASSDCIGIEADTDDAWQYTNFPCEDMGTYAADLMYCDEYGVANNWEGTLKLVDGATTKYYAGYPGYGGSTPAAILRCVASSQFWVWRFLHDGVSSYPPACTISRCGVNDWSVETDPAPIPTAEECP
jgi:hypothetical protein